MPLEYDDIPGSWGVYSKDWPHLTFTSERDLERAYVACTLERIVPYGSYVRCDPDLRVETKEQLETLKQHLKTCEPFPPEQPHSNKELYAFYAKLRQQGEERAPR